MWSLGSGLRTAYLGTPTVLPTSGASGGFAPLILTPIGSPSSASVEPGSPSWNHRALFSGGGFLLHQPRRQIFIYNRLSLPRCVPRGRKGVWCARWEILWKFVKFRSNKVPARRMLLGAWHGAVFQHDFRDVVLGVVHVHVHCVHEFLKMHHSGTQFFLGNVDWFFDPEIRQLHSPGG